MLKSENLEDQILAVRMGFETLGEKKMREIFHGDSDLRKKGGDIWKNAKITWEERRVDIADIYIKNTNVFIAETGIVACGKRMMPSNCSTNKIYRF